MPSSLTFSSKDILNSLVIMDNGSTAFTTHSTKGFRGRKVTSLTGGGAERAVINWRQRTITIGKQSKSLDFLKRPARGWWSSARTWQWGAASYELHYSSWEWTASSSGTVVARFYPYHSRVFHQSDPATLLFMHDLPPFEATFLLVAFIYMEMRRQDKQRSSAASAGAAAGGGGGGGGGC
ncbi:hypothetical protein HDZ31DRAFT_64789 [Schizophyllum fasciatum]